MTIVAARFRLFVEATPSAGPGRGRALCPPRWLREHGRACVPGMLRAVLPPSTRMAGRRDQRSRGSAPPERPTDSGAVPMQIAVADARWRGRVRTVAYALTHLMSLNGDQGAVGNDGRVARIQCGGAASEEDDGCCCRAWSGAQPTTRLRTTSAPSSPYLSPTTHPTARLRLHEHAIFTSRRRPFPLWLPSSLPRPPSIAITSTYHVSYCQRRRPWPTIARMRHAISSPSLSRTKGTCRAIRHDAHLECGFGWVGPGSRVVEREKG